MKRSDFERYTPPKLNEKMLRERAEKRRFRRLLFWLSVSVILMQFLSVVIGLQVMRDAPETAMAWLCESAVGGIVGVIAVIIYLRKRKEAKV